MWGRGAGLTEEKRRERKTDLTSHTNRDDGRLLQVLLGDALNGRRHRRREQRRHPAPVLALLQTSVLRHRQLVEDVRQLLLEPEIDHPVRLVHDDVRALAEHENVLLEDVLESSRRSNDDLGTVAEVILLLFDRPTSNDRHAGVAQRSRKLARLGLDLLGELSGRGEDQGEGTLVTVVVRQRRELADVVQQRDNERRRLSGS